jgi:protein TonB
MPAGNTRISSRQERTVNAWSWGCSLLVHGLLLFWLSTVEITRLVAHELPRPLEVTLLPAVLPPRVTTPSLLPRPTISRDPPAIAKAQRQPLKKPHTQTQPRMPRLPSSPVARAPKTQPSPPPSPAPPRTPEPPPPLPAESGNQPALATATAASSDMAHHSAAGGSAETPGTTAGGDSEDERRDGAPLPISRVAEPPVLLSRVMPTYPPQARRWGVEGLVRLEAILNREGYVEEPIKILESVPLLDDAASVAVRQWRFTPARDHHGRRVRVILEVPLQFVLN